MTLCVSLACVRANHSVAVFDQIICHSADVCKNYFGFNATVVHSDDYSYLKFEKREQIRIFLEFKINKCKGCDVLNVKAEA